MITLKLTLIKRRQKCSVPTLLKAGIFLSHLSVHKISTALQ